MRQTRLFRHAAYFCAVSALILMLPGCVSSGSGNAPYERWCPECPPCPPRALTDPLEGVEVDDGRTPDERREFIREAVRRTVRINTARYRSGSGITHPGGTGIVLSETTVLTAYHVVRDSRHIEARIRQLGPDGLSIQRGRTYEMTIVSFSEERDVALLQIVQTGERFPVHFELQSRDWEPAEGERMWHFGRTTRVHYGRLTDLTPPCWYCPAVGDIEIEFKVVPGDSGGPVLTNDGRVAGVILCRNIRGRVAGYFMPINVAMDVLRGGPER